jgi:aminoglycoside phosphotransferase
VGDLGRGEPEIDLAAAIWSLDYNLGPGCSGPFLREYGWPEPDDGTIESLRRSYETV